METTGKYRVYIAGAMESVGGNMNIPLFNHVAKNLRAAGCVVFNPAEHFTLEELAKLDKKQRAARRRAGMKQDFNWIFDNANIILLLPGWEKSPGAVAENALGLALGITVRELPNVIILDEDVNLAETFTLDS
jgi:hypothetical protein